MDNTIFNKGIRSSNANDLINKCSLCKKGHNQSSISKFKTQFNRYSDLNSDIKIHDPIFFLNKQIIENMLNSNYSNEDELISPCSCEKKFHKSCILLSVFYSNNVFCESCLDIYNIKSTENMGMWSLMFSKRYYHSFILNAVVIVLLSLAIFFLDSYNLQNPELYSAMKIFFTIILTLFDSVSIIIFIINWIKVKKNTPPLNIHIESKETLLSENELSRIYNINSENQNSNQNLITNNITNLSALNRLNKNNKNNPQLKQININNQQQIKQKTGLLVSHFNSTKNFVDYNEFFFNVLRIEIFESKLNLINKNKITELKHHKHLTTLKELNDDEFQQNILIKYMDFNSSSDSFGELEDNERRKLANMLNAKNKSNRSNRYLTNNDIKKIKSGRNVSQDDLENESDNETYYKKLNGMIPDFSINNGVGINKKFQKNITIERENSENLNTNINSVSLEKLKSSHKDLTGLNISNINNENKESVNGYFCNNNEEKLILRENNLSNHLRRPSNSNSINNPTGSFKVKSIISNKDINSNDSMGSYKFNKVESTEGINYRDFIVTEEKDFTNNGNLKYNNPRKKQSTEKIGFGRKDSKIPSAVFGDFKSFRSRNSASKSENHPKPKIDFKENDLSEKINSNSNMNIFSHSQQSSKALIKAKVSRKYSSFSPMITKTGNAPLGPTLASDPRKPQLSKSTGGFGMNIFSNNVINNSSLEKSMVQKTSGNMNSNFDYNHPAVKINSISDTGHISSWKRSKWSDNNSVLYNSGKTKINLIKEELGFQKKNTSDSNNNGLLNASYFNSKQLTISPSKKRKFSTKDFNDNSIFAHLRQSVNLNLNNDDNEYISKKLENLSSTQISQSVIGMNRNTLNKLNQENFLKSDSNVSANVKNVSGNNNENLVSNTNNSSIIKTNSSHSSNAMKDDKNNYLIKTCFMKETELKTIIEECELAVNKNRKNSKLIIGYDSEFVEETKDFKNERNKSIISSESNKFVDYPKDKEITNLNDSNKPEMNLNPDSKFKKREQGQNYNEKFDTIKNIKNHLMDNTDNIIAEDDSDSDGSSESSEDEDSISSKSGSDSKKTIHLKKTLDYQKDKEFKTQSDKGNFKERGEYKEEGDSNIISKTNKLVSDKNLGKNFSLEELDDGHSDSIKNKNDEKDYNTNNEKIINKYNNEDGIELIDINYFNDIEVYNANKNEIKNEETSSIRKKNLTNDVANSIIHETLSECYSKEYSINENNNNSSTDNAFKSKHNENQFSKFNELKAKEDKLDKRLEDHDDRDDLDIENLILVNSSEDESERD